MKVFAMIPARSGSKGLPDKNIKPAGGVPLIGHAVAFAEKLGIDRIVVSTDSQEYFWIGRAYHRDCVWHARGDRASSDTAMEEDIIADYVEQGHDVPDIWVWLKPTSPFRSVGKVGQAIEILRDRSHVDAVRIISEADARIHQISEMGWLEPAMPLLWPGGRSKARRSEFPKMYDPFNLEIFRHQGWKERGSLFMGHAIVPIVDHKITGMDINGAEDLDIVDGICSIEPRPTWLESFIHA